MKKAIGLVVSLALLALIWWRVDLAAIGAATRAANPWWLAAGLLTIIPLTLMTAARFGMLCRTPIGLWPATRLILSASTLNLVLPSKMGDLAKGWVLTGRYGFDAKLAVALVVMERSLDMASLLAWGVLALLWVGRSDPLLMVAALGVGALLALLLVLLSPWPVAGRLLSFIGRVVPGGAGRWLTGFAVEWREAVRWFWSDRRRVAKVWLVSLAIWGGHLAQFWLFAQALAPVPFLDNMAFATLAILAGLLPLTMAGIGTRDAAILFLYRDYLTGGQAAVLGVLATLRYLLPAIAGLPFMGDYLQRGRRKERVDER
jgi:glycosyltransferase 2 family protein